MTHVRKQIRDAFKTRLKAVPGIRKFAGARARPFREDELPALQVVTPAESIQSLDRETVIRTIDVDVLVHVLVHDDDVDDAADLLAAEIEELIRTATGEPWDTFILFDPAIAELAVDDEPGEQALGVLRTRFQVRVPTTSPTNIGG